MIAKKAIREVLRKAKHPEMNKSLPELGMIRKIKVEKDKVVVTLVVPFLHVPIREDLIKIIKEKVKKAGIKVGVVIKEMNRKEKKYFGGMVRKTRGPSPW